MTMQGHTVLPPGLFDRAELALLASRAAIALDAGVRSRPIDVEPIRELGSVLASGLGHPTNLEISSQARLADPETTELLSRAVIANPSSGGTDELQHAQEIAESFVRASRGDITTLEVNKLIELRDFSIRLSIAARSPRSTSLAGFPRFTR